MESPAPVSRYTPKNSKKRVMVPGSSSWCNEVEVIEVPRPVNRSPKPMSSKQKEKVIYGEIIDLDMEEDSDNVQVGAVSNGKEPMLDFSFDNIETESDGFFDPVVADDSGYSAFYKDDDWIDKYYDDLIYDDDYEIFESHFDNMDIPPGVEAAFPWFPSSPGTQLGMEKISTNLSLELQLDGTTPPSSCNAGVKLRNGKKKTKWKEAGISQQKLIPSTSAPNSYSQSFGVPLLSISKLHSSGPLGSMDKNTFSSLGGAPKPYSQPSGISSRSNSKPYSSVPLGSMGSTFARWDGIPHPHSQTYGVSSWSKLKPHSSDSLGSTESTHARWDGSPNLQSQFYGVPLWSKSKPHSLNPLGSIDKSTYDVSPNPHLQSSGVSSLSKSKPQFSVPLGYFQKGTSSLLQNPVNNIGMPSMETLMSTTGELKNEGKLLESIDLFRKFDTVDDCSDHYFFKNNYSEKQQPKKWAKKIQEEWRILEKDLPEKIFVRVYESRMDLLRAVIIGAEGTPYHDGLFFFDVFFPSCYPDVPPHVHYHSGGLRINPNLYHSGKVCLSLLNTWGGSQKEMWLPGVSTMLQVLVSIQALILNANPYFNEPGYEHSRGSENGQKRSLDYNENTFISSLKTMEYSIRRPPKHFEDLVVTHYCQRARAILIACKAYLEGAQVGCLVEGGIQDVDEHHQSCSSNFKKKLFPLISLMVNSFTAIGAKECDEFLCLAAQGR